MGKQLYDYELFEVLEKVGLLCEAEAMEKAKKVYLKAMTKGAAALGKRLNLRTDKADHDLTDHPCVGFYLTEKGQKFPEILQEYDPDDDSEEENA